MKESSHACQPQVILCVKICVVMDGIYGGHLEQNM